uniref:Vasculin-like protein 1 n=1 Tax=Sphaerodactylus townsendi TaxID=933632 RepID=A0ACB8F442_9SAUR
MAQHDFVPAWLNFSTPQSAKAPGSTFEKHGEHLPRGEVRFGVSRRRHNSSDGFFNNGPLRTAGDCWHQPSLHRHDSVDSGVSKGTHVGLASNPSGWHGSSRGHDGMSQRGGGGTGAHRHWNGNFHSRKGSAFQEKPSAEAREEKEEKEKLQFEEDDFDRDLGTEIALVILVDHLYREPMPNQWKANRNEHKQTLLSSSRDSAFTSPVSVTKPAVLASGPVLASSKESPSSTTPPIEINSSRLTKLMRRSTDKKSEFLKALKDDRNGEMPERHESSKLEYVESSHTPEPKENWDENCHQNGLSLPLEEGENLSHSLEAEHRLLKAMGWQEYPENDENCLPLTEDELREFQIKSEQLRRNGFRKNGFLQGRGSSQLFSHWRSTFNTEFEESDTETSSSETSDDDA